MIERPTYVEPLSNGSYGLCDEAQAKGIAYEGEVYHLEGRPALDGPETVSLVQVDSGAEMNRQADKIKVAEEDLTNTQLALCEVYELLTGGMLNG